MMIVAGRERSDAAGFSLVEALVALFMIGLLLLGIAQMMGTSLQLQKASEDLVGATALAEHKLEELRNEDYVTLAAGGSLGADSVGYFDSPDVDGDGNAEFNRRWQITDLGPGKIVRVRVMSLLGALGPAKDSTLMTLVAQP